MNFSSIEHPRTFFLVFDRGDEVIDTLRRFAIDRGIRGAHFAALGAFESATIAFWNRDTQKYENHEVGEQCEVLSLLGDIAIDGDETRIHSHVTLGRSDFSAIGGHLVRAVVYPTLEMHLADYDTVLTRRRDEESRLHLIRDLPGDRSLRAQP